MSGGPLLRISAAPALAFFLIVAITSPALAQKQADQVVPPAAFDRPFEGRLITFRAKDTEELREACRWPVLPASALGCANYVSSSICGVTMASDEVIQAAGYTAKSSCAMKLRIATDGRRTMRGRGCGSAKTQKERPHSTKAVGAADNIYVERPGRGVGTLPDRRNP